MFAQYTSPIDYIINMWYIPEQTPQHGSAKLGCDNMFDIGPCVVTRRGLPVESGSSSESSSIFPTWAKPNLQHASLGLDFSMSCWGCSQIRLNPSQGKW